MGKTIDKVILALSDRPSRFVQIDYNRFYVTMSRFKKGKDIRFLINTGVGIALLNYLKELAMSPNVKYYFDGFEKDTLKWNQNLTYESTLRTQKKKSSLLHNTKRGKNKYMVRKIKRCTKSLCKTRKELIKDDFKQYVVNGKTNMMVRNISRSFKAT